MTAPQTTPPDMLTVALAAYDAGLCVIPARKDGKKSPISHPGMGEIDSDTGERRSGWTLYKSQRPTRTDVIRWFGGGHPGMGVVCGQISGRLLMLELEGRAVREGFLNRLTEAVKAAGIGDVLARIAAGYMEETPSGGIHWLFRIGGIGPMPGNQKLAQRPATADELVEAPGTDRYVLIETRGEGGFTITAPSHGPVHPSGKPWTLERGGVETIVTITADEYESLVTVCRSLDEMPAAAPVAPPKPVGKALTVSPCTRPPLLGTRWMDAAEEHYNRSVTMLALLEQYGWTHSHDVGGRTYVCRPGKTKEDGIGGSIMNERLTVFSTSTPFAPHTGKGSTTHSRVDVLAMYEHGGNRERALRAIADAAGWNIGEGGRARLGSRAYRVAGGMAFTTEPPVVTRTDMTTVVPRADIPPANVNAETGEITRTPDDDTPDTPDDDTNDDAETIVGVLPEDFWTRRPVFGHILQAARARRVPPDTTLHAVLARIVARTPHKVKVPPIAGSVKPLTLLTALVGDSSAGKSASNAVACELIKGDPDHMVDDMPVGSGEGLAEALFDYVIEPNADGKNVRVKKQVRHQAYVFVDEGEVLGAIGSRSGSTLFPTIRTTFTGGTIGQANASKETHRRVPSGSYVYGIVVCLQPTKAGDLLADAAGGTPQRFLWARAVDPGAPDVAPAWPGPLQWEPPSFDLGPLETVGASGYVECHVPFPASVVAEVDANRLRDVRGKKRPQIQSMDAHLDLIRLKVAAALAILDGRVAVTEEDWELTTIIVNTSRMVRAWVGGEVAKDGDAKEWAATERQARRAVVTDQALTDTLVAKAARRLALTVHKAGPDGVLHSKARSNSDTRYKDVWTEAVEYAVEQGWIVDTTAPGQGTPRRVLTPGESRPT